MSEILPPNFDYDKFDLPSNVELSIYFGPHKSENDLPAPDELKDIHRSSDVVVIEAMGADQEYVKTIGRLSKGDFKFLQRLHAMEQGSDNIGWKKAFYSALYNSRTTPVLPDLPRLHPLIADEIVLAPKLFEISAITDFDLALQMYEPVLTARLDGIKKRDQIILGNIAPGIQRAMDSNSRLATKSKNNSLKVSMFYGGVHLSLYDALVHKKDLTDSDSFSVESIEWPGARCIESDVYGGYLRTGILSRDQVARHLAHRFLMLVDMNSPDSSTINNLGSGVFEDDAQKLINGLDVDELNDLRKKVADVGMLATKSA